MSRWIAEFELEDDDTMPEHMDLMYNGAKLDFHCRPMWIPCREKLPSDNKEVLVYLNTDPPIPYIACFEEGEWRTDDFTVNEDSEPIAWMPLPEPCKVELRGEE